MKPKLISAIVAILVTTHGCISGWSVLGMDTIPFTAVIVMWAYYTFVNRKDNLSAILTLAVVLMRLEGVLILPVWAIVMWNQTSCYQILTSED